jgi:B12 binding domain
MKRRVALVEVAQIPNTFPLASAYLVNYARRHSASAGEYEFDIRTFHVTDTSRQIAGALAEADVYTFSCYSWNMRRIVEVLAALREARPKAKFLLGGPQVLNSAARYGRADQSNFFVCNGEGEPTIAPFLDVDDGDYSRVPGLSFFRDGELVTTPPAPQVDLNTIPSPFLNSPLNGFFTNYLWETNRGCPFHCTFCVWGQLQDSISQFEIERLKEEITWMARQQYMSLHICDANWAMFARDVELAEHIAKCKRDLGVPFIVTASHIKNQPERSLRMARLFADVGIRANPSNALQSLNPETLVTIKRRNTSLGMLEEFQNSLGAEEFGAIAELIWPLPEETLQTLTAGLARIARMRMASALVYPLMLLNNTEMSARRAEHGFEIVPDAVGAREVEWVVATRQVSRAQCEEGFWFYLAFLMLYNARNLYYTLHYLADCDIPYEKVLWDFAAAIQARPSSLNELCRRIVIDRNPALDGDTYGLVFGFTLHSHRDEFDALLADFCSSQDWWQRRDVRAVVELDALARPFPFRGRGRFKKPGRAFTELDVEVGDWQFAATLPEEVYQALRRDVEVGELTAPRSGPLVVDHRRDQLPLGARRDEAEIGYLLTSILANVRTICPRFSALTDRSSWDRERAGCESAGPRSISSR